MRNIIGRLLDFATFFDRFFLPKSYDCFSKLTTEVENCRGVYNKIAIVSSFEKATELDSDFLEALHILTDLNYYVVLVANCDVNREVLSALPKSSTVLVRDNYGRDFGAYRTGCNWILPRIESGEVSNLILMNDSMTWNSTGIQRIIRWSESKSGGVISLTDSRQREYHLQSYFFFVKSDFVKIFVNAILSLGRFRTKRAIIHRGERKLSKILQSLGVPIGPVVSISVLIDLYMSRRKKIELFDPRSLMKKNTAVFFSRELAEVTGGIKKHSLNWRLES
jgi:lipopolysaccharide biosynthesis protein